MRTIVPILTVMLLLPAAGVRAASVSLTEIFAEHGVSGQTATAFRSLFESAARQGVPLDMLEVRLREGLVKRASPDDVLEVLRQRKRSWLRARQMLDEQISGRRRNASFDDCCTMLAGALDSGLPEEVFDGLLAGSDGARGPRLQALIEVGELLHLAGVEHEDVRYFLLESHARQLRRGEILHAARFWIVRHRQGAPVAEIREQVWKQTVPGYRQRQGARRGASRGAVRP